MSMINETPKTGKYCTSIFEDPRFNSNSCNVTNSREQRDLPWALPEDSRFVEDGRFNTVDTTNEGDSRFSMVKDDRFSDVQDDRFDSEDNRFQSVSAKELTDTRFVLAGDHSAIDVAPAPKEARAGTIDLSDAEIKRIINEVLRRVSQ